MVIVASHGCTVWLPTHLPPLLSTAPKYTLEETADIADQIVPNYSPDVIINFLIPQSRITTFAGGPNNYFDQSRRIAVVTNNK